VDFLSFRRVMPSVGSGEFAHVRSWLSWG
jgi:hypothetical protein